jgi:hypothetical protein
MDKHPYESKTGLEGSETPPPVTVPDAGQPPVVIPADTNAEGSNAAAPVETSEAVGAGPAPGGSPACDLATAGQLTDAEREAILAGGEKSAPVDVVTKLDAAGDTKTETLPPVDPVDKIDEVVKKAEEIIEKVVDVAEDVIRHGIPTNSDPTRPIVGSDPAKHPKPTQVQQPEQ